jgi:hypothetical protein
MEEFVLFLLFTLVVYATYYLFVFRDAKKLEKYKKSTEVVYLVKKYKLNLNDLNFKKLANILGLTNGIIISFGVLITSMVDNYFLMILVGFISIFLLILIMYHLIGTYYKKGE